MNKTDKYAAIAESTYSKSFWSAMIFTIILFTIHILGYNIPDEIIRFVKDVLWIFVLPITVKIIGVDSLPKITELIRELRNTNIGESNEKTL
jgi:hypothetical protein